MPNFATDADLLAYDPALFIDLPIPAEQTLRVDDAAVAGTTLTSVAGGFDVLSVGHVLTLRSTHADAGSHAVAAIPDPNTVDLATPPLHLAAHATLTVIGRTFREQTGIVHDELLRAIGLDPDDPRHGLDETAVRSVNLMRHLETLGTLALIYGAAAETSAESNVFAGRAALYCRRFQAALASATVLIDTNGDGHPDLRRTPQATRLVRV